MLFTKNDTHRYSFSQYPRVVYSKKLNSQNLSVDKFEKRRLKLIGLIRDRCEGVNANLARRIKREPSYVNRLLYPDGKKGKKKIGDEIMDAVIQEFNLPNTWWADPDPSEFTSKKDLLKKKMKDLIDSIDDEEKLIKGAGFLDFVVHGSEAGQDGDEPKRERRNKKE